MIDYNELTVIIDKFTKEHVKKSRYEHCVRVAQMCVQLCKKFGLDEEKGYFIGIAHDMCKDFPSDKMIELASKDGEPIYEMEREKTSLLHGRAAAVLLKEEYGVDDSQLLEAIANHTSGIDGMCDYTKILYLADKIEPGREHISDVYRQELLKLSLDEMAYKVIYENYLYIKEKGYKIYPSTERMLTELRNKLGLK